MFNLKGVVEFYLSVLYSTTIASNVTTFARIFGMLIKGILHTQKQIRQEVNTKVGLPANGVYFVMTKMPSW